jgi:hypothetical protein
VRQSEYVAYVDPVARTTSDDETGALKEEEGTPEVSIWANPTKGKMNVLIATPRTQEAMLELITTNGSSMLQQQTITNRTTEMDLTGFPKGMYLLRASVGKYRRTEKVIKE